VDDTNGNGDGFLDAGESGELRLTLRNYGEPATQVTGTLHSDDPYLTITQTQASFGNLPTGGWTVNEREPFELSVATGTPMAHVAELDLELQYEGGQSACTLRLLLGRFQYMVWDPSPDQSSGPVIASTLAGLGYTGLFVEDLPDAEGLRSTMTLWVSVGVYSSNHVIPENSDEALAIESFMADGGHCYMEGADLWYYDPGIGGHDFGPLFGVTGVSDGSGDCFQVQGQAGTFAQGMSFAYAGENSYMDHIMPTGGGEQLLRNLSPSYCLGVLLDAGSRRSVAAAFEFAGLVDGTGLSTKAQLAGAIMGFFLGGATGAEEAPAAGTLSVWPNPFNPSTTLSFVLEEDTPARLAVYDLQGRRQRLLLDGPLEAGEHRIPWNGLDGEGRRLSSGVYFVRLETGTRSQVHKLILLK